MICTCLTRQTFDQCLPIVQAAEMVELRLDLLPLSINQVIQLVRIGKPAIATFRKGVCSDQDRLEAFRLVVEAGVGYVDLEVEEDDEFLQAVLGYIRMYNCKLIISYHNFTHTPEVDELQQVASVCKGKGATIVKLVTMAHNPHDAAKILSLYPNNQNDLVAFAMGSAGKITRIAAPLLGAPFTYAAPAAGFEAASGQLTNDEMLACYRILGVNSSNGTL